MDEDNMKKVFCLPIQVPIPGSSVLSATLMLTDTPSAAVTTSTFFKALRSLLEYKFNSTVVYPARFMTDFALALIIPSIQIYSGLNSRKAYIYA